jgi:4-aminobutyrate aminotransferase-like enzyme
VGTGFSRTGDLFATHGHKFSPDIIVLAKANTNGSQVMATMVTKENIYAGSYQGSKLQSTFGWNPVACAVALKTLEIHLRDQVWLQAREKGKYMQEYLKRELGDIEQVGDIRGLGMEIGLDLVTDKTSKSKNPELSNKVTPDCFESGLHFCGDHEGFIQLMPPLTIATAVLDEGLAILTNSIKKNINN